MFRLTREVRFAINPPPLVQSPIVKNGYAGAPALLGLGPFFTLDVTLAGELDRDSQYVRNIKEIDDVVRAVAIAKVAKAVEARSTSGANLIAELFDDLKNAWPGAALDRLELRPSPYTSWSMAASEKPMVRLSQTFEFSAAHRLHNPALDDAANAKMFGKCNNPLGHGHNYILRVTMKGTPDADGVLIPMSDLDRIVEQAVLAKVDHKFLNAEVEEFREQIPSVENIAAVIYRWLKPALASGRASLASVTVWETSKTSCEYSEA